MIDFDWLHNPKLEHLLDSAFWSNYAAKIYTRGERFFAEVEAQFGMYGIYILLAFAALLLLIIFLHIKSVSESFKSEPQNNESEYTENASTSMLPSTTEADEQEVLLERERELSKYLVMQSAITSDILHLEEEHKHVNTLQSDDKTEITDNDAQNSETSNITPLKNNIDFAEFITLVLNLLGRKVSESKIAQALYYYYHNALEKQDIMRIVRTARDFISFCNNGYFDYLPLKENLPQPKEAILAWAKGNPTFCLLLLQANLNQKIAQAENEQGIIQDMSYAQAANCAILMGNIARLSNKDLAHNAFELAVELSPKSTIAWSNLADSYMSQNAKEKALIAYQNVLEIADPIMYAEQCAEAKLKLAEYYQQSGLFDKAQQFSNESNDYYTDYGITQNLTFSEDTVFKSIWQNKNTYLSDAVNSLLSR